MRQLLMEALRWWVVEYQVDGFCFVNADNLTQVRMQTGKKTLLWQSRFCRLQVYLTVL